MGFGSHVTRRKAITLLYAHFIIYSCGFSSANMATKTHNCNFSELLREPVKFAKFFYNEYDCKTFSIIFYNEFDCKIFSKFFTINLTVKIFRIFLQWIWLKKISKCFYNEFDCKNFSNFFMTQKRCLTSLLISLFLEIGLWVFCLMSLFGGATVTATVTD